MATLYGIKNCDTIKKARNYLKQKDIHYSFHDYRIDGLSRQQLQQWTAKLGWQALVNKRSATWRQLSDPLKDSFDEQIAIETMLAQPTLIKRPLLEYNCAYYLGFSVASYDALFADAE
jgi:Spx/MgsR family transcriptional regulator